MGTKLCWVGLAIVVAAETFGFAHAFTMAGAIVLAIGAIAVCLDK